MTNTKKFKCPEFRPVLGAPVADVMTDYIKQIVKALEDYVNEEKDGPKNKTNMWQALFKTGRYYYATSFYYFSIEDAKLRPPNAGHEFICLLDHTMITVEEV